MSNDKRKYIYIGKRKYLVMGIIAGIITAVICITAFILIFNKTHDKSDTQVAHAQSDVTEKSLDSHNETDENEINETKENETKENETDSDNEKVENTKYSLQLNKTNSWESNGRYFCQYDITLVNDGDLTVKDWSALIDLFSGVNIEQSWNAAISQENQELKLLPVEYNKIVNAHSKTEGIGFIMSADKEENLSTYKINLTFDDGTSADVDSQNVSVSENDESINSGNGNNGQNNEPEITQGEENNSEPVNNSNISVNTSAVGALHVSGTAIVDEQGNQVQLRGVSTHGLAWFPQYVNYDAFATLKNDWNCNVVRLSMYTAEYGGYCNGGDQEGLKSLIDNGVNYAASLGLYVIIDWHILSDGNPQTHQSEAVAFFNEMSSKYSGYNNVIYEICNEPVGVSWNDNIKPYATEVINTIRANDSDAIILVGTNNWSQNVDDVVGNRIENDSNVMYVVHFYAGTHRAEIRNKIQTALNAGVPVFVSECSICDASGNGGIDYDSANTWLTYLNQNAISFIAWSLCNKNETSALISSGCSDLSGWSIDQLSDTGKWFRSAIRGD